MKRVMVFLVMVIGSGHVPVWGDEIDAYVASLNTPQAHHTLGVTRVSRPEPIANQLEVTFESGVSPTLRSQALSKIGQEFLVTLFRWRGLLTATVTERNPEGTIVEQVVVTMVGSPMPNTHTSVNSRGPC